jgi:hypothetical protein
MMILFIGSLRNVLLDSQVNTKDITMSEQNELVTVSVINRRRTKRVSWMKSEIIDNPNAFVTQLVEMANWYHGGSIPQKLSFAEWVSDVFAKPFSLSK